MGRKNKLRQVRRQLKEARAELKEARAAEKKRIAEEKAVEELQIRQIEEMLEAISNQTSTNTHDEKCQLCSDPMPPYWDLEGRNTSYCCGQSCCKKCRLEWPDNQGGPTKIEKRYKIKRMEDSEIKVLGDLSFCGIQFRQCPFCKTNIFEGSEGKDLKYTQELKDKMYQSVKDGNAFTQYVMACEEFFHAPSAISLLPDGDHDFGFFELILMSARQGYTPALRQLGGACINGAFGTSQNLIEVGLKVLRAAMLRGNGEAAWDLSDHYMTRGNSDQAFECMETGSKLGYCVASYFVGEAYYYGNDLGRTIDKQMALHYFKIGSNQGSAASQWYTANLYRDLDGNMEMYEKYMLMAAEKGNHDAQKDLGWHYVDRDGSWIKGKSFTSGVCWLRRSSAGGCDEATKHLRDIEKKTKRLCFHCGKNGVKIRQCSRCRTVNYCSKQCQKAAWKSGHKEACVTFEGYGRPLKAKGENAENVAIDSSNSK